MNVTEAVKSRRSVRQFLDKPVDQKTLQKILETAARSPSGGNTQPWNAVVVSGDELAGSTLTGAVGTSVGGHNARRPVDQHRCQRDLRQFRRWR